jgi:hypothetical protein
VAVQSSVDAGASVAGKAVPQFSALSKGSGS